MKLACCQPAGIPLFYVAVVFPLAFRLSNGMFYEAPPRMQDGTGQAVPVMQPRISCMGLN